VPVVQIGVVRVAMHERCVRVAVTVGLAFGIVRPVCMIVHVIMVMPMLVNQGIMHVLVYVRFGQVQIHAHSHERAGDEQTNRQRIVQQ
jgi:hypothetical protein